MWKFDVNAEQVINNSLKIALLELISKLRQQSEFHLKDAKRQRQNNTINVGDVRSCLRESRRGKSKAQSRE